MYGQPQANLARSSLRAAAILTVLLAAEAARAQQAPPLEYIGAALSTTYDSNVTREPAGPQAVGSTIDQAALLAGFDHTYGKERVYATASLGRDIYVQYPLYDYTSQQLQVGLTSNLRGDVITDISILRTAELTRQEDLTSIARNVMSQDRVDSLLRFRFAPQWYGVLGAGAGRLLNSNPILVPTDLNSVQFQAGARYQTGSENYVDLLARSVQATYPQGGELEEGLTTYHERGGDLRTKWRFSGSSEVLGRVGFVDRKYVTQTFRDFAGPAYDLTYLWTPWSKIRTSFFILRAMGAPGDNDYLSAITHTLRVTPTYVPTEDIRLEVHYEMSRINYSSDLQLLQLGLSAATTRVDRDQSAGAAGVWTPRRWLQFKLEARRDVRDSSLQTMSYIDWVAMFEAQAKL